MQNLQKQDAADWARLKKHTSLADKLDELSTSLLAQRAARRKQNSPQGQAAAPGGQAKTVDLNAADGAATRPAPSSGKDTAQDASTPARHYNLSSYNEPHQPKPRPRPLR